MAKKLRKRILKAYYYRIRRMLFNNFNNQPQAQLIKNEPFLSLTPSALSEEELAIENIREQSYNKEPEDEELQLSEVSPDNIQQQSPLPVLVMKEDKEKELNMTNTGNPATSNNHAPINEKEISALPENLNLDTTIVLHTLKETAEEEEEEAINIFNTSEEDDSNKDNKIEIQNLDSIDISPPLPPQPVVRDLDEIAQKRIDELFPGLKDNGLIYAIFLTINYMVSTKELTSEQAHDAQTYIEYIHLDNVIKVFKRRDFPGAIRQRLRNYLSLLTSFEEPAPKQSEETYNSHREYAIHLNNFIKRLDYEDLMAEFVKRISYDIEDLLNHIDFKELIKSDETDQDSNAVQLANRIQWINPDVIKNRTSSSNKENEFYSSHSVL